MVIKKTIRNLIDELRMAIPGGRQFLDKSKDISVYDIDDPKLPLVDTTITLDKKTKTRVKVKKVKK